MKLTLESIIKDVLRYMVQEQANPIIADFKEFGHPDKSLRIEFIHDEEETDGTD